MPKTGKPGDSVPSNDSNTSPPLLPVLPAHSSSLPSPDSPPASSPSPLQSNLKPALPLPAPTARSTMANFPAVPFRYVPEGAALERGPAHRLARKTIVVDDPPLSHDRYALVTVSPAIPDHRKELVLQDILAILRDDFHLIIPDAFVYPIGIGMVAFEDVFIRDAYIRESPHQLDPFDDNVTFSLIPHDEGENMRLCPFQYVAWILFLAFPMDYQTDHYINKAVSCFGKLELWHKPGQNKERVLVRVIINDIALVPHSLVVRRSSQLPGMGRSWSVPVYILNGRNTIPGLVGNEDDAPPMNASPHLYELPYLSAAQQWQFDHQQWVQQQVDDAWNQGIPQEQQLQDNGWGLWPVVPPPYRGFSFRTYFQYTGPSLMDGVEQESNISDDPQDEWSVYSDIAEAADNFIRGIVTPELQFVRAGGEERVMVVDQFAAMLELLGSIYAGIQTPRLTESNRQDGTQLAGLLPFNPLCLFAAVRFAMVYNWDHCIPRSLLDIQFAQILTNGLFIDKDSWSTLDTERQDALMTYTQVQSLELKAEEAHVEQFEMLAHDSNGASPANFTGPVLKDQNMHNLECETVAPPSSV